MIVRQSDGLFFEVVFPSWSGLLHQDELRPAALDPASLVANGDLGRSQPYLLRLQAHLLRHAYRYDLLSGLSNARIEPQLHQVYVAHQVTNKLQPRMILADEVGLGKTIEAGLVIKELVARQMLNRILIVCPASLVPQWQHEMSSKFNERFEIMDGLAARYLASHGENPWQKKDRVIASLQFASQPRNAERIAAADWDLVIFDEAHRVRRWRQSPKKVQTTQAYRLADDLKEEVNGVLLLTATPMQLQSFELYSLIELVEPGLFGTFDDYERRRQDLPGLNDLMKSLKGWSTLDDTEQSAALTRAQPLLKKVGVVAPSTFEDLSDEGARDALMEALVNRHPLAAALVRNRKAEIGGFTPRSAHRVPVTLGSDELTLYNDVTAYIKDVYNRAHADKLIAIGFVMVTYQKMLASSSSAIRRSFLGRIEKLKGELSPSPSAKEKPARFSPDEWDDAPELSGALRAAETVATDVRAGLLDEIRVLEGLAQRLGKVRDSKALALMQVLIQHLEADPDERVLVFTQFIETQRFLAAAIEQNGYTAAIFNGEMSIDEKEAEVLRFRNLEARVLVSTDAGGEGRNFQFCHIMVNYDLPWNPMKVEQRIGRLDRIGQKRPVAVYNLACADTVEDRVLNVLEQRIGLFEESVGSLDPILGNVERDIEKLVLRNLKDFDEEFEQYAVDLEREVRRARERERALSDFILDRASLRRDKANELLQTPPMARPKDLESFTEAALTYFGGSLKPHNLGGQVIALSPHLVSQLHHRGATVRGIFDPDAAREHEELDFFAFGHPTIEAVLSLAESQGETALSGFRRDPGLGSDHVEVWYVIESVGVRPTGKIIHHLVSSALTVESRTFASIPDLREGPDVADTPPWVAAAIKASRQQFDLEHAEERLRIQQENDLRKREELDRAERIFHYRQVRYQQLIRTAEDWVAEHEHSGNDRDRKILPARRGRLEKDRERLELLTHEYRRQTDEIHARDAGTSARVIAAGVVLGR